MKKIILTILILIFAAFPLFGCNGEQNPSAGGAVSHELLPSEIAANMQLYSVEVESGNEVGSGFIIAADSESVTIATCYHVVDGSGAKQVRFFGKSDFEPANKVSFYAYDAFFDVAFLRVELDNSANAYLGLSKFNSSIKMGEKSKK